MTQISLGLDTFGDVTLGPDGQPQAMDRVLREVLDQATLADEIGIDFIGHIADHKGGLALPLDQLAIHPFRQKALAGILQQQLLGACSSPEKRGRSRDHTCS